jgi:hypothetical protein
MYRYITKLRTDEYLKELNRLQISGDTSILRCHKKIIYAKETFSRGRCSFFAQPLEMVEAIRYILCNWHTRHMNQNGNTLTYS